MTRFQTFLLLFFIAPLLFLSCNDGAPTCFSNVILDAPEELRSHTIPLISIRPEIDGNLSDWSGTAFSSGTWNLDRVKQAPWYDGKRNKLEDHDELHPFTANDLSATYYMALDGEYLYLGAEVSDNANDVTESKHAPRRWYYKDAIAWFLEVPRDTINETFGAGDHAFAFVVDSTMPDYGAWWRHGNDSTNFIEEPIPQGACDYAIQFHDGANYTLEARVNLAETIYASSDPKDQLVAGSEIGLMIVHCDPDGGEYGGHLLIYGSGDPDSTWTNFKVIGNK